MISDFISWHEQDAVNNLEHVPLVTDYPSSGCAKVLELFESE